MEELEQLRKTSQLEKEKNNRKRHVFRSGRNLRFFLFLLLWSGWPLVGNEGMKLYIIWL